MYIFILNIDIHLLILIFFHLIIIFKVIVNLPMERYIPGRVSVDNLRERHAPERPYIFGLCAGIRRLWEWQVTVACRFLGVQCCERLGGGSGSERAR
jgi:hypothetical protein